MRFKNIIIILLIFISSCSPKINYIDGHKIIRYGTKEFENFEKNATIKKEEAWAIQKEITSKHQVPVTHWLFFIIDKKYIFTTSFSSKRETELKGISVDSDTGEVKNIDYKTHVKYENFYNGDNETFST
ncbi:hypothetical protein [Flavobacterium sp. PL002]|uniref:hypothetical protein n=1 Tax=Flavobacterium sp. PL002 TaxID=1897058 RepID=UPI0017887BDE|nr:hypothetical protein [Flavobacterium sp. PL002]MBE0393712.1 hypothetical protein [Flavobacterium sp. PL002]